MSFPGLAAGRSTASCDWATNYGIRLESTLWNSALRAVSGAQVKDVTAHTLQRTAR